MKDLITNAQAAVLLGRSYDHTRKVVKEATIPAQEIGQNKLWHRSDIPAMTVK
jgi:hypothetical protein